MPSSDREGKRWAREWIRARNPISVVDVGPGCGTYSELLRQPTQHWTGIEIFEPYVERFHLTSKYDELVIDDVRTCPLPDADLYILGDVLEHMDYDQGHAVVRRIKHVARSILVSIPIIPIEQGCVHGNIHETHRVQWTYAEMIDALKPHDAYRGEVLGVFGWDAASA